jgi:hypothetical protein
MTDRPYSKRIVLPESIPPEMIPSWHEFLATLPLSWWEGKTPEERGEEAVKLWKNKIQE